MLWPNANYKAAVLSHVGKSSNRAVILVGRLPIRESIAGDIHYRLRDRRLTRAATHIREPLQAEAGYPSAEGTPRRPLDPSVICSERCKHGTPILYLPYGHHLFGRHRRRIYFADAVVEGRAIRRRGFALAECSRDCQFVVAPAHPELRCRAPDLSPVSHGHCPIWNGQFGRCADKNILAIRIETVRDVSVHQPRLGLRFQGLAIGAPRLALAQMIRSNPAG